MIDIAQERRKFPRIEYRVPISYKRLRVATELTAGALSIDIGEGGIRFVVNEFLSLASRLVLEISIPNSPRPIKAISKIAWIRKLPMTDQYEAGNQFLDMTKEDKRLVASYINSALTPKI